jgi:hypothetical protein
VANAPFATKADLAAYWRALTADEQSRADIMLPLASNRLRLMAEDLDINLDEKAAASEAYTDTLRWVVMEAVKRALSTPTDQPPVDSISQTAGPYSENYKFTNPSGDLWFKKSELSALGLYGRQTIGSISTSRKDIYS